MAVNGSQSGLVTSLVTHHLATQIASSWMRF